MILKMSWLENPIIIQIPTLLVYYWWGNILLSERDKLLSLLRRDNLYLEPIVYFLNLWKILMIFETKQTLFYFVYFTPFLIYLWANEFLISPIFILFLESFLILSYYWIVIAYSNILNKIGSFIFSTIL